MVASFAKHKIGEDGRGGTYHLEAAKLEDYYSNIKANKGKEPPGVWYIGTGASGANEVFGIHDGDTVNAEGADKYKLMIRGYNPMGGRGESPRKKGERIDRTEQVANADDPGRVCLFDFTYTAPKSVSVIWSQADDDLRAKIEAIQERAIRKALGLFQDRAAVTRLGEGGLVEARAQLVSVIWAHGSSRENDPLLHSHATILNICQRHDGTVGTIDTATMMKYQGAAASLYHAELAHGMAELGAKIDIPSARAIFEIEGVPEDVMKAFSQRSEKITAYAETQIEKMCARLGMSRDQVMASRGLLQVATLATRDAKAELTRDQLQAIWAERGAELGFTRTEALALLATEMNVLSDEHMLGLAREAVAQLAATSATFTDAGLITAVAVKLQGLASADDIINVTEKVKVELFKARGDSKRAVQNDDDISLDVPDKLGADSTMQAGARKGARKGASGARLDVYTTRAQMLNEHRIVEYAKTIGNHHRVIDQNFVSELIDKRNQEIKDAVAAQGKDASNAGMAQEQIDALRYVTKSDRLVSIIQGRAGAGKTFTMRTMADIFSEHGYETFALATSHRASKKLAQECNLDNAFALTGFIKRIEEGTLVISDKTLLILDEAGQTGTEQMCKLLAVAQRFGSKVVLTGDTKQQSAVAAGDPLRQLAGEAEIGSSSLEIIRRQTRPEHRDAVMAVFDGRAAQAIDVFDHVTTHGDEQTHEVMIRDWLRWREDHAHLSERDRTQLIVTGDNKSMAVLNSMAHAALVRSGELSEAQQIEIKTMHCNGATGIETMKFCVGEQIVFRTNEDAKSAPKGQALVTSQTRGVITSFDSGGNITIMTTSGRSITINQNDEAWARDGGLAIQHTYCDNVFQAQGQDVAAAWVKDATWWDSKQAGVALSRHRDEVKLYIDGVARYDAFARFAQDEEREKTDYTDFVENQMIARVAQSYSRTNSKENAHDYASWSDAAGLTVEAQTLSEIERIKEQSKHSEMDRAKLTRAQLADQKLPIESMEQYELRSFASEEQAQEARVKLGAAHGISAQVMLDAEDAGFVVYAGEQTQYAGRDEAGRVCNLVYGQERKPPPAGSGNPGAQTDVPADERVSKQPLRHRYLPILFGSTDDVHIVERGADALALWTMADQAGELRPTVIVCTEERKSWRELGLMHSTARQSIERAQKIVIHADAKRAKDIEQSVRDVIEKAHLSKEQDQHKERVDGDGKAQSLDAYQNRFWQKQRDEQAKQEQEERQEEGREEIQQPEQPHSDPQSPPQSAKTEAKPKVSIEVQAHDLRSAPASQTAQRANMQEQQMHAQDEVRRRRDDEMYL